MRLQTKVPLLIVPLVLLPLLVVGWVSYDELYHRIEMDSVRQMRHELRAVQQGFDSYVEAARANLQLFSNSGEMNRYLLEEDEGDRYDLLQPGILALFSSYQRAHPDYFEIRIILPDGYEDTRAVRGSVPNTTEDESGSELFQALTHNADAGYVGVSHNPDTGRTALFVGCPITSINLALDPIFRKPELRGYMVISSHLPPISRMVRNARIGRNGYLVAVNNAGEVIFDVGDPARRGLPDRRLTAGQLRKLRQSSSPLTASGAVLRFADRYWLGRQIHPDMLVAAVIPEQDLLDATRGLAVIVFVVTVGTTLFVSGLVLLAMRKMLLNPLGKLRRAAAQIGSGNMDVDIRLDRRDELGHLAGVLEEMGRSLLRRDEQIRQLAYHDSLTSLPNRRLFGEYVRQALASATRSRRHAAVLFVDLDGFKSVNDTLGHRAGDALLVQLAGRLQNVVRPADTLGHGESDADRAVSRRGGDEFTVLLPDLDDIPDAARVAHRIIEVTSEPFILQGHVMHVGASVGIAVFPEDGRTVEQLVQNADVAMYHAKLNGKGTFCFFHASMNERALGRLQLENALRDALVRDELRLFYQPKVRSRNGTIAGGEALIRWQHPELGLVGPGDFIPMAEETGLIIPIGEWVVGEACRQIRVWLDEGLEALPVSVNISNHQFRRGRIDKTVLDAIEKYAISPSLLQVEITESNMMDADSLAMGTLETIREAGVLIGIDDFGTGYSSLALLRRMPVDVLKIDYSFVRDLPDDRDAAAIACAILAMAKSLNLTVVAEGVETSAQLAFLREQQCSLVQGFYFSRPVPAAEFAALL